MIERRAWPRPQSPSVQTPSSSGPRCRIVAIMRHSRASISGADNAAFGNSAPAMPHMAVSPARARPIAGLRRPEPPPSTAEGVLLGDITPDRDWSRALRGVGIDIVVHLAQRAHSTADPAALAPEPAAAAALARAAARAGARRFVYLSSIVAMGMA